MIPKAATAAMLRGCSPRERKMESRGLVPAAGKIQYIHTSSTTRWRRARRSASPCLAERTPPPTGPSLHPPVAKASDLKTPK